MSLLNLQPAYGQSTEKSTAGGQSDSLNGLADRINQRLKKRKEDEQAAGQQQQQQAAAQKAATPPKRNLAQEAGGAIVDIFSANTPDDIKRRQAAGQPAQYGDQKAQAKQTAQNFDKTNAASKSRGTDFSFSAQDVAARRQFYKDNGIDLDQMMKDKSAYDKVLQQVNPNDIQALAHATKMGQITPEAKRYQAQLKTAKETEQNYQRTLAAQNGAESGLGQAERGFTRGFAQPIISLPSNAESVAGAAIQAVAPGGSRIQKAGDRVTNNAEINQESLAKRIAARGYAPQAADNALISGVSEGAGSLGAGVMLSALPGGAINAAGTFGVNAAGETATDAKKHGLTDMQSFGAGATSGVFTGILTHYGLENFMNPAGNAAKRFMTRTLSQAIQNAGMSASDSLVRGTYSPVDLSNAIQDAVKAGGMGALFGATSALPMHIAEQLQKRGVGRDEAILAGTKMQQDIQNTLEGTSKRLGATPTPAEQVAPAPTLGLPPAPVNGTPGDVAVPTPEVNTPKPTTTPEPKFRVKYSDGGKTITEDHPTIEAAKASAEAHLAAGRDPSIEPIQAKEQAQPDMGQHLGIPGWHVYQAGDMIHAVKGDTAIIAHTPQGIVHLVKQHEANPVHPGDKPQTDEQGTTLYHGTAKGTEFDGYDPQHANNGVGSNAVDQGDHFYLTENKNAAQYFGNLANDNKILRSGTTKGTGAEGDVLAFKLKPDAKVLTVPDMPRGKDAAKAVIDRAKKDGYDAVRFPDRGFNTVEGSPLAASAYAKDGTPPYSHIILNHDAVTRVKAESSAAPAGNDQPAISPENADTVKLRYPKVEDLPQTVKDQITSSRGSFGHETQERLAKGEVSQGDLERAGIAPAFRKVDIKTLLSSIPQLKENPMLTARTEDGATVFHYKDDVHDFKIRAKALGLSEERLQAAGVQDGTKIDLSEAVKPEKGAGPVATVRRGGTDYSVGPPEKAKPSAASPEKGAEAKPAEPVRSAKAEDRRALFDYMDAEFKKSKWAENGRTAADYVKTIEQLHKAGQAGHVLRRGQLRSKKAAGMFSHRSKEGMGEVVKLRDDIMKNPQNYAATLAHEMSHATEFFVTGSTRKTYSIFGELSKEERSTIETELKNIVNELEGKDVAMGKQEYYYRPTEMLARYVETMVLEPGKAEIIAPTVTEKWRELMVREPRVMDLMDAIAGQVDKGYVNYTPSFLKDMRQTYRKMLGKRAGDMAYNAEVVRRAEVNRSERMIKQLVKQKFKGVKDDAADLFHAAEAIKVTKGDDPTFGTSDFMFEVKPKDVRDLVNDGWKVVDRQPVAMTKGQIEWEFTLSKQRYSEAEAKDLFEKLSPEGQRLIKDFTAAKDEAKDEFNRELMKQLYHIDSKIEGWVHHYFDGKPMGGGKSTTLRTKIAAAKKQRKGAEGYIEDFRKATTKALLELDKAEINNEFIAKQLARISKPIVKGAKADPGWVEVVADGKGGLRLPGEGGMTIIQVEEGKTVKKSENRYQVPEDLARHYREIREVPHEASTVAKVFNNLAKYWTINVLVHPGTASTNFISGGLQYGGKIMNDFYLDLLTANFGMSRTRANLIAPIKTLTPNGWTNAPDWLYGGYRSNLAGQYATSKDPLGKGVDVYGDKALALFGAVETYWKKTIAISEGAHLKQASSRRITDRLSKDEQDIVAKLNEAIDEYAFDYDNKPLWLSQFDQKGGKIVKPFSTYPYKLTKFYTGHIAAAFDRSLPWQERAAKVLAFTTIVAGISMLYAEEDRKSKVPKGSEKTPSQLKPGGRVPVGIKDGMELFTRSAKYPFFNLTSAGKAAVERNGSELSGMLNEQLGSIGPGMDIFNLVTGRTDQFTQYTPKSAIVGGMAAEWIPGFRILNDVGRIVDTKDRNPKNFVQGLFSNIPVWGSENLRTQLRGDVRTIKIPNETDTPRSISKTERTFTERDITHERSDILLSLLTGIYIKRIDPKEAQAQQLREVRDKAEKDIRAKLAAGNQADALTEAEQYGFTIPQSTMRYYEHPPKKKTAAP